MNLGDELFTMLAGAHKPCVACQTYTATHDYAGGVCDECFEEIGRVFQEEERKQFEAQKDEWDRAHPKPHPGTAKEV